MQNNPIIIITFILFIHPIETNKFEEKAKREKTADDDTNTENNGKENTENVGISDRTEEELLGEDELMDENQQDITEAAEEELLAD